MLSAAAAALCTMSSRQFLEIQGHTSFSHKLVLWCLAKKSVVSTTIGVRTENWLRIEQVRIRTKIHFRPIFRDVGTMSKRFLLQHLGRFWWKRPLFLFINCVLNLVDMVTDSIACSYLFLKMNVFSVIPVLALGSLCYRQ